MNGKLRVRGIYCSPGIRELITSVGGRAGTLFYTAADARPADERALVVRKFALTNRERKLYELFYDHTHGAGRETCVLNLPELSLLTGFSAKSLQVQISRLEQKRLVTKVRMVIGRGKKQGVEYQVNVP